MPDKIPPINELEWDDENLKHIAGRGLTTKQIREEAFVEDPKVDTRWDYDEVELTRFR